MIRGMVVKNRLSGAFHQVAVLVALAVALCGLWAASAHAGHIEYRFSGIGGGMLNGQSFVDTVFNITVPADTVNVSTAHFGADTPAVVGLAGTLSVSGIGSGIFADQLYVYNYKPFETMGLGIWSATSGTDYSPFATPFDILTLPAPGAGLDSYDLNTAFGPLFIPDIIPSNIAGVAVQDMFTPTLTGSISFDMIYDVTFQAVPEPSALVVLGSGILGMAVLRRKIESSGRTKERRSA